MKLQHMSLQLFRGKYVLFESYFIPRRYRYKKKWAVNLKSLPNCQKALSNFDAFYKPHFDDQWPSIRVSLLSLPKYCAVVNKYGKREEVETKLEDLSATDFVDHVRNLQRKNTRKKESLAIHSTGMSTQKTFTGSDALDETELNSEISLEENGLNESGSQIGDSEKEKTYNFVVSNNENGDGILEPYDEELYKENISVFVPTEQVFTEKDQLLREEMTLNTLQPGEVAVKILPFDIANISRHISAYVFPRGNVARFPQPRSHNRIFEYYLMDAASVMPVIALDVQPTDKVLDLCAAPGGKSYLILQNLDFFSGGTLTCNDSANARLTRLKNVLSSYFPRDIVDQVSVTKEDGRQPQPPVFNKVLVDAPCNSDRHVVTEDENNLFKISRTRERLGLMETQKELLISAIKSCVPGGSIVYSTCTLSPVQNDGVIQAAFEDLWETSQIEVAVEDLTPLAEMFSRTFKFHTKTRYGQLILPTLLNNFGPSYFAKLKRIK